ncbi:HlyD family secretion protein [Rufibacter immobilis]|uniref:HlyD family secretion protein n=1 Tax=Rufibacter immobilis TaxID=1348778 RepID=A0A3M9N4K6_9BACT|nr:HlyD family secretion protein [Rufibacter immobilis]RNI31938.1 HlyD family secretion protein [Rufibacter immobilis]
MSQQKEQTEAQAQPKKRKVGPMVLNTLLLLAVAGGLLWVASLFFDFSHHEVTNDAQVEQFITPINARVGGYIDQIRFTEHQPVKKGDTLVVINDNEIRIQLAQAEAAYLDAVANRNVTSSSVNTVSNNVGVSEANIAEAKARLENLEVNYRRYESLLQDEAVTRQQYEQVKTEYDAARARYRGLLKQKQTTQLSTQEVKSRLAVNDANIKRAAAALDMAKLNLKYTVITAPYDGVVGRRTIQEGQLIQPGQALVSIVRAGQIWVVANYKETQTGHLSIGQKVEVEVDAIKGKVFTGQITAISEATGAKYSAVPTDNSTGNFVKIQQRIPVRIDFTSANSPTDLDKLRAGMNVEVKALL